MSARLAVPYPNDELPVMPVLFTVKKPTKEEDGSSSEEHFDIGEAFEDIVEGAFGIFRQTLKTAGEVAHNLVTFHSTVIEAS